MLARNWFLWELTGSPLLLGLMNFSRAIPRLAFGLFAGVLADRVDKRIILLTAQTFALALKLTMAILITTEAIEVWHILALAFLTGSAMSFISPSRESMTPQLVPQECLVNAISLNRVATHVLRMLTPAVAGVLIVFIDVDGVYYLAAGVYGFILFTTWRMRTPTLVPREKRTTVWGDARGAMSYIGRRPTILQLLMLSLLPMLFGMPYFTLLPIFATEVLQVGPSGYGLIMGVSGVGALAAAMVLAAAGDRATTGWLLLLSIAMFGGFLVAFSFSPWLALSLVLMVGVGVTSMVHRTIVQTLLLHLTPQEMYGRIMAIHMLDQALMPFGSVAAGALAGAYGAPVALSLLASVCVFVAIAVGGLSPRMRHLGQGAHLEPEARRG
jgi:predicted MFS family arabinose efflux permease